MNQNLEKQRLLGLLEPFGQTHVMRFWDELNPAQKTSLAAQITEIDWEQVNQLASSESSEIDWTDLSLRACPPPAFTTEHLSHQETDDKALAAGLKSISNGQVAFVLTAGGQGSRLGFDHPKGMFPIGPVSNRTLFQMILDHCRARGQSLGVNIPVYIMTSPQTDSETREFLKGNNWFDYDPADIGIFCQGVMPAVGVNDGKVLMSERHEIFTNPDGHGGALAALKKSGALADMQERGVRQVFYGQIDNPLLQICDPRLIGCHIMQKSEMTTQVIRKTDPLQKVGNVVSVDGTVRIIEYSDLPEEAALRTDPAGNPLLWAGSIAVHVFELDFLQRQAASEFSLPFHRACKRIPYIDESGNTIDPTGNNGIKFERFIFDLLPEARNAIVCEVAAEDGFAAVKNAPPAATETPEWVRMAIGNLHRRWIEQAGCQVADGVTVEISPLVALDAVALAAKLEPGTTFEHNVFLDRI